MIYLKLLLSFMQVGVCSFGGGYVALPLIQNQVVDINGWLTLTEFSDIITIAEMTPGPIALNAATFVGTKLAGLPGAVVATVGCITPSVLIVLTLAWLYTRYRELPTVKAMLKTLRPASIGLIASAGFSIALMAFFGGRSFPPVLANTNWVAIALFAAALIAIRRFKLHPVLAMLCTGVAGVFIYAL